MSDPSGSPSPQQPSRGEFSQSVDRPQIAAIVPESVARGVYATAPLVFTGQHEMAIDFMQSLSRPYLLASRVVLPPGVAAQFTAALQQNLEIYRNRFGGPVEPPAANPPATPPDVKDIYERHKVSEAVLSGVYANAVLITHSYSEFCFDFITTFYPRAAVSARIYLAAPVIPGFLRTLNRSLQQFQAKHQQAQQQILNERDAAPPPPPAPPTDPTA